MDYVRHISEFIQEMYPGNTFSWCNYEQLDITNVKEVYWSLNSINYMRRMHKHNDFCTSLDNVEGILLFCTITGSFGIQPATSFNHLSSCNPWQNTCRAYVSPIQHCQIRIILPLCITTGISFERCRCVQSPQRHHVNLTWICIRSFPISGVRAAMLCMNRWWLEIWSLWTGTQV